MYIVSLDKDSYFTGSYAKIGSIPNGVSVESLPPDINGSKAICWKLTLVEEEVIIDIPTIDPDTKEVTYEKGTKTVSKLDWVFDGEKYITIQYDNTTQELRKQRDEAFVLLDKYQLVLIYENLTEEQQAELAAYRQSWLDVTNTRAVPIKPEWLV